MHDTPATRVPASYTLLQRNNDQCARVRFTAHFRAQPVTWTVEVMSLHEYYQHHLRPTLTADATEVTIHPFIDVTSAPGDEMSARVAVGVTAIDEPTLRKVVVMMRQYRLLRPGKHEFNPPATFRAGDCKASEKQ